MDTTAASAAHKPPEVGDVKVNRQRHDLAVLDFPDLRVISVCWADFRSLSHGRAAPVPLMVARSADGGSTWAVRQVGPATSNGINGQPDGCIVRTDSQGNVYVFGVGRRGGTSFGGKRLCHHGSTCSSIQGMKVSVSLPDEDVEFLDSYAQAQGIESRSAAVHKAVGLLRNTQLGEAYEEAWDSWQSADDADAWESAAADGLGT